MVTKKVFASEQSTVEVRIIDFKLTGSDEALRESLQTISSAFGRQNVQVGRALPVPRASAPAAVSNSAGTGEVPSEDEIEPEDDVQDVQPRAPSNTVRKPAKAPVVKVLPGLNFTDTNPTLKEFFESKGSPAKDLAKYLVVAHWYKNVRDIPDLTPDHFHTAFRALNVPTPKNALQPIRDLRNNRNGKFTSGSTKGTCTIHHIGENWVNAQGKAG